MDEQAKRLLEIAAQEAEVKGRSLWSDAWSRLLRNKAAMTSVIILSLMTLAVVFGPIIMKALFGFTFDHADWDLISAAPSLKTGHIFGTDAIGRDLFVRTLYGGRISLLVGVVATLVSLAIGITYGATSGFLGGRVDNLMMRFVDILYTVPFIFLVILLMVFFGRNIVLIFVAIGAISWLDMARIVRGQTLSLKGKEFIEASRAIGVSTPAIIRRHIIPNLLGIVVVYITLTIPRVILVESFLSFLGLGVQEPMTSWGALVNEGAQEMESAPWMLIFPGVFLAMTLFCFNFIGDGLRDALDPKDR
ncbi:MAG: ABC transporter permease subunit [Gammaproteobacteria bacterium]|nr:ABC transporter permease subunit [Gammaproteobacteria bacterium]NNC98014.1 ABC transporter permease subunit [Gammaproteobacteria bacterium]NNM13753.1 ABC transporter permease subunit [Gammaproteobacteria bacterium]